MQLASNGGTSLDLTEHDAAASTGFSQRPVAQTRAAVSQAVQNSGRLRSAHAAQSSAGRPSIGTTPPRRSDLTGSAPQGQRALFAASGLSLYLSI